MANTLKGWLADNTVTTDPNDKILVLESAGAIPEKVAKILPGSLRAKTVYLSALPSNRWHRDVSA